jgi:hypothetical protein
MTIRSDLTTNIRLDNIDQINDKSAVRIFLLNQSIIEAPNTKFRYFVDSISNSNRIFLERLGRLNKGCDFVIYIENNILNNNGNDKTPPLNIIFDDLASKKQALT